MVKDKKFDVETGVKIFNKSIEEAMTLYNKHLKGTEDIQGLVLKTHLIVEKLINDIILLSFIQPKEIIKMKFSVKLAIYEAMNIDFSNATIKELKILNKIRNRFAHNLNYIIPRSTLLQLIPEDKKHELNGTVEILKSFGLYTLSFLIGTKSTLQKFPYLFICVQNRKLYEKDVGFNYNNIIKWYNKRDIYEYFKAILMGKTKNSKKNILIKTP